MKNDQLAVTNPYDGSELARLATDDQAALESALSLADERFRDRANWLPLTKRIEILRQTQALMRPVKSELALLIAQEGGKPLTDAMVEVERAIEGVGACADHITADLGTRIPVGASPMTAGHLAVTLKEPLGVVAAVSAFNHPLNLIVHQVAPAIASGCPVIVKPAPDTPLSCLRFVELLHEAGLPPGWCQSIITDDIAVAEALVTDPRLGLFSFIGSARVGWMLKNKLAPGVRCALEHGGAAPVVLCEDADLKLAVPSLVKGGYYHAGQVCVSVQRIFVPRSLRDSFVAQLRGAVDQLMVGDPCQGATEVGPLIRPQEVVRVAEWVQAAIVAGADCVQGGQPISDRVYAPTVLSNPPADALVSQREIFGPVVCVYDYEDEAAALTQINGLNVAFQAAVYTQSMDRALGLAKGIAASAVMINEHTAFRDDIMPFAGLRESGLGIGGIPYTLDDMQVDKMIIWKSNEL